MPINPILLMLLGILLALIGKYLISRTKRKKFERKMSIRHESDMQWAEKQARRKDHL